MHSFEKLDLGIVSVGIRAAVSMYEPIWMRTGFSNTSSSRHFQPWNSILGKETWSNRKLKKVRSTYFTWPVTDPVW